MRKIFSMVLIFGLILGIGSVGFADQSQESKKTTEKEAVSEDFILFSYAADMGEAKQLVHSFRDLVSMAFLRLSGCTFSLSKHFAQGVTSQRFAIVLHDFEIITSQKHLKSDLAIACYIDELQEIIKTRKCSLGISGLKEKYAGKWCEGLIEDAIANPNPTIKSDVIFLIPEVEKIVQEFMDSVQKQRENLIDKI